MTPAGTIRVAAVQMAPRLLDLEGSLEALGHWAARAADEGARLMAFPECILPGYPAWLDVSPGAGLWDHAGAKAVFARLHANGVEVPGPATARLAEIARRHGATLAVGVHERSGRSLYNALLVVGPDGSLIHHHRKLVPTHTERLVWGRGDGSSLRVVDADGVRVGGLICWEHWMPLARQVLHDAGEQVHVAAWPWVREMSLVASRHHAFEGRCFVVAAGSLLHRRDLPAELPPDEGLVGTDGRLLRGGSAVIAPDGRLLAGPVMDEETVVVADCDLGEIARESMALDVSGHYARPDVFDLRVRGRPVPEP